MTAKEYLMQLKHLSDKIDRLEREKKQLLELASTPAGNSFEPHYNPNSPTKAAFEKFIDKAYEVDALMKEEQKRLTVLKDKISELILALDDADERYLLLLRYIKFASWEQIATDLHYSISWVYKLHGRALQNFQKKIVEDSRG